jgi:hypothetical protein
MKNRLAMVSFVLLVCGITLNNGGAWASAPEAVWAVSEKSRIDAPLPPTPLKKEQIWNAPINSGWGKRFFDNPLSHYNFPKSQERTPTGSGIPLKSPGLFPGIEFDVEMHSLGAWQSVVPAQKWSKTLDAQQDQPLLVAPSNISPDYNGGFLRFTW